MTQLTNTEILMFIVGWQGGTIHQLATRLGVDEDVILNADADKMRELMRLAQSVSNKCESCGVNPAVIGLCSEC